MLSLKNVVKKPIFLFVISYIYVVLLGINVISENISGEVLLSVLVYSFSFLLIQTSVLWLALKRIRGICQYAIAGCLTAVNLIAFYLSFFEKFLTLGETTIVLISVGLIVAIVFTYVLMGRYENFLVLSLTVITINCIALCLLVLRQNPDVESNTSRVSHTLEKYKDIKFKAKPPNVHLVSFDSMIPESVAQQYMGVKNLPYAEYLKPHSQAFPDLYVTEAPTLFSVNSIMRLSDPNFSGNELFAGRADSPLAAIFRENGYKISTAYSNNELFGPLGSSIDEFRSLDSAEYISDSTLCKYSTDREKAIQIFGFCLIAPNILEKNKEIRDWHDLSFEAIGEKGNKKEPWFTFDYIYDPIGHTDKSYSSSSSNDRSKYTQFFTSQSERLANLLPTLVRTIKEKDPDSIVFIFGDHGPWLSRTIDFDDDPNFFINDRYAVYGSILDTNHSCTEQDLYRYRDSYLTVERVVAGIVRCLAIDPKTVDRAVNFKEFYKYSDYLLKD